MWFFTTVDSNCILFYRYSIDFEKICYGCFMHKMLHTTFLVFSFFSVGSLSGVWEVWQSPLSLFFPFCLWLPGDPLSLLSTLPHWLSHFSFLSLEITSKPSLTSVKRKWAVHTQRFLGQKSLDNVLLRRTKDIKECICEFIVPVQLSCFLKQHLFPDYGKNTCPL